MNQSPRICIGLKSLHTDTNILVSVKLCPHGPASLSHGAVLELVLSEVEVPLLARHISNGAALVLVLPSQDFRKCVGRSQEIISLARWQVMSEQIPHKHFFFICS